MIFKILLKYIGVSLVISLIFGATVFTSSIIKKRFKKDFISQYLFQILSFIVFIIMLLYSKSNISIFSTHNLLNWKNIILLLVSIIPTSIIAYNSHKIKPDYSFKLKHFLDGATMEIPQRLLVQNLFLVLGVNIVSYSLVPLNILLNAIIWLQFIIVQEIIQGEKLSINILPELIASFWFSIWVGILYQDAGNIIIPMLAHGFQRTCTYAIRKRFGKLNPSQTKI
ncbi:hypothetical protein [Tissierella sp.]|uniref:hypothetical protein n=1 Tax=Tissierella sp. TaxID=41274 RepID=UPI002854F5A3|nr:hypothetical protein [Tissierella sp.]MDR7856724.1 hypothetical protein [Tissierella sp.]